MNPIYSFLLIILASTASVADASAGTLADITVCPSQKDVEAGWVKVESIRYQLSANELKRTFTIAREGKWAKFNSSINSPVEDTVAVTQITNRVRRGKIVGYDVTYLSNSLSPTQERVTIYIAGTTEQTDEGEKTLMDSKNCNTAQSKASAD